jgi:N-acetylglucosaminyl-diphospho-decaprenol L-rhamnosyltransferase
VADNTGNADGTSDAIRAQFPEATVLTPEENLGFGRATNRLAELGRGEAIVLVNDDVDTEPRFLEELVAPLGDPAVGMVAGLTLQPGEGDRVDGFGIEVDPILLGYNRLRHRRPDGTPGALLGPSGGAAAYRRTAWEQVAGFDDRFFAYGEDEDLALRMRLAGWQAAAAANARGVHLGGATTGRDSPFQRRHAGFARGFLLRRYGILRSRHAMRAVLIESLTVLYGLLSARTLLPLKGRISGWRAAGWTPRLEVPADAVDPAITLRESLRRLRHER